MSPDFLERLIRRSVCHQHGNNRELSAVIGMHKMECHVIRLTPNMLLAGPMKMELEKLIFLAAYNDLASRCVVDLNGVAVVNDAQGRVPIFKLNRRQARFRRPPDVDRRLGMALAAIMIGAAQVCPILRSIRARIAPFCFGSLRQSCDIGRGQQEHKNIR